METSGILKTAVKALDNKKGQDITVIKIDGVSVIGDYFVIVTATSAPHIRSLCDEVEEDLSKCGVEPKHIEGRTTGWTLLDYGDVIIHIMDAKNREFYNLERTWNDGTQLNIQELIETE